MNAQDQTSIVLAPLPDDATDPNGGSAGGYTEPNANTPRAPMTDEDFQSVVATRIEQAITYAEEIGTYRARGTRFYRGDIAAELPQKKGRSGVVSRDLRDTVQDILPSLMRIFAGIGKTVNFVPRGPEDEDAAQQATDYCDYLFREKNDGFMLLHTAIKDTLLNRIGPCKVWWHEETTVEAKEYSGIGADSLQAFLMDAAQEQAEITDLAQDERGEFSFTWIKRTKDGKTCAEAMPPEDLIYTPSAKSLTRPLLIGEYTTKTVGELVAMGYDYAEMVEQAAPTDRLYDEQETARRPDFNALEDDASGDPTGQAVEYIEAYTLIDKDGDGIPEMRRVCCVGPGRKVVDERIVDDHPFAVFLMEPEPHTPEGLSMADCLDDIQLIRSHLMRMGFDGLSSLITPRLTYTPGVNLKQLMDPTSLVEVPIGGAVAPLPTDKAAPEMAMTWYDRMGQVRADRTGMSGASQGLEPDALQSISRISANALVQRAQGRLELIARILAETGMRRIMKLILRNVTRYQQKADIIKLRGNWIPMDPSRWHPDMDVKVNVGLGTGNAEERLMGTQAMMQVQQTIMQQMGPDNPLTDIELLRNSLEDFAEAQGKSPSRYFLTTQAWQQKQAQLAQQPKGPPPEPELVQAEREKAQIKAKSDADINGDKLTADAYKDALQWALQAGVEPTMAARYAMQSAQLVRWMISQPRTEGGTQLAPGMSPPAPNRAGMPDMPPPQPMPGNGQMPPGMQ